MKLAFDPNYLAKQAWWKAMPGSAFFRKATIYVKQGNVGAHRRGDGQAGGGSPVEGAGGAC